VAGACLGVSDLAYRGDAWFSTRHVLDFTMVRGESSSGEQPWHFYLTSLPAWSDPFLVALVALGIAARAPPRS
jgi:hypothetical protein